MSSMGRRIIRLVVWSALEGANVTTQSPPAALRLRPGSRSNENRVDPTIGESSESGVKILFSCCGTCVQLQAEAAPGWLDVLAGRLRIKNKSDRLRCRDQVAQELQPFRLYLAEKDVDTGHIGARTVEA